MYYLIIENIICPANFVKCPGSYCLPLNKICDGQSDCPGGTDEINCGLLSSFSFRIFILIKKNQGCQ